MMAYCMIFMLRFTNDIKVWKTFEFGILITDFTLFLGLRGALETQERLDIGAIRWEEWGTIAITGFVTLVRIAFLVDVGFKRRKNAGHKTD